LPGPARQGCPCQVFIISDRGQEKNRGRELSLEDANPRGLMIAHPYWWGIQT